MTGSRPTVRPATARPAGVSVGTSWVPGIAALVLVLVGGGGAAATAAALLGAAGPSLGLVVLIALAIGLAGWALSAAYFARRTHTSRVAALQFDAWTYAPLVLLYLPTLRDDIPAAPLALAAGLVLVAKLPLYAALPGINARHAEGRLVSLGQVRLIVSLSVVGVSVASLAMMDSFQIGSLAGNIRFMVARPDATYVERMAEKGRGHHAAPFEFVRAATPEDAVVLIPPGIRPWYAESDISLALAALWPRRVREAQGYDLAREELAGVTHVLVTVVRGKPLPDAPASFRWPGTFPPGRFIPFDGGPWGLIALEPPSSRIAPTSDRIDPPEGSLAGLFREMNR